MYWDVWYSNINIIISSFHHFRRLGWGLTILYLLFNGANSDVHLPHSIEHLTPIPSFSLSSDDNLCLKQVEKREAIHVQFNSDKFTENVRCSRAEKAGQPENSGKNEHQGSTIRDLFSNLEN